MTNQAIREGFNQMISAAAAAGNADAVARMELASEFFTNTEFKAALQEHVWQVNQAGR